MTLLYNMQGSPQKKKSSGRYLKNLNLARASSIIKYLLLQYIKVFFICVVCLTVCVPSPYSSIRQSYVILIEFEWNGLKESEADSLENRKFLEESHLNL